MMNANTKTESSKFCQTQTIQQQKLTVGGQVRHRVANDTNTNHHLEKEIRLTGSDVRFPDVLNVTIQLGLVPSRVQHILDQSEHFVFDN
jgi:hypothetical protein